MPRLVLFAAVVAFLVWRGRKLNECDRTHGFGAYAKVVPVSDD